MYISNISFGVPSEALGDRTYKASEPSAQDILKAIELSLRFRTAVLERLGEHRYLIPDDAEWLVEYYHGTSEKYGPKHKNHLNIHLKTKRSPGDKSYNHLSYLYPNDPERCERNFDGDVTRAVASIVQSACRHFDHWTPVWEKLQREGTQQAKALETFWNELHTQLEEEREKNR